MQVDPWGYGPFRCRVCACCHYARVRVRRSNGDLYVTEFYACANCSTMFLDPRLFTSGMPRGGNNPQIAKTAWVRGFWDVPIP